VKSYYVLGYSPPEGTFPKPGKTPRLHSISVSVKRPGLKVRTRKGFLGFSDPPPPAPDVTPAGLLREAARSPFVVTQVPLRATALAGYGRDGRAFARAILQIDAQPLAFAQNADGRLAADVDVLGMAFDQDGNEVGHLSTAFTVALRGTDAQPLRPDDGLVYVLNVPIAKPGAYQVRFAVRDRRSGALGSTGQFVSIQDVAHGAFALSGILVSSVAQEVMSVPPSGLDATHLLQEQARREFAPGARLSYGYEIYNARQTVQATATVWRDQVQVLAATPDMLTPPANVTAGFAVSGKLGLGQAIRPGRYVLQISATTSDRNHPRRKPRIALQQVEFDVR
jgi:hypothetical protein